MGCGNTKQIDAAPPSPNDPVAALDFEYSTPMLVMPFLRFKEQGRIYKST
jgi:hypothetical protein